MNTEPHTHSEVIRRRSLWLLVLVAAVLAVLIGVLGVGRSSPSAAPPSGPLRVTIVDGDTVAAVIDGERQRIRILGINTPEVGECGADAASQALSAYIDDKPVQLTFDEISEYSDRYGRLLAYIDVDGVDVGLQLVTDGYATAWWPASEPAPTRADDYTAAEAHAADQLRGNWASCAT